MKYVFAAAAVALLAATPAAAKSKGGCGGDAPAKMVSANMASPYDQKRMMMDKKINKMNLAMSKGDMRGCNKAMKM